MDLFRHSSEPSLSAPLAERIRPQSLADLVGQDVFLAKYKGVIEQFRQGHLLSLVLWGPPGCGKTSFVKALTKELKDIFLVEENAIDLGAKKLKEIGVKDSKLIQHKDRISMVKEIKKIVD
mgnify:CR=1 FL=1